MNQTPKKQMNLLEQLTLSLEGSHDHVNPTPLQEKEKAKKMIATSGHGCLLQLKQFNHVGLWVKTFTELLIGQEGWYSTKCKLTWKLRATKYSRMYCQLVAV